MQTNNFCLQVAIASILILATITSSLAQTFADPYKSPRRNVEFNTGIDIATHGFGVDVGIQYNVSPQFSLISRIGGQRLNGEFSLDRAVEGGRLSSAQLRSALEVSLGVRLYSDPNNTGWFGGVDYVRRDVTVEATSRKDATLGSALTDLVSGIFLFPLRTSSVNDVEKTTKIGANAFRIEAGYAFDFGRGGVLDVALFGSSTTTTANYSFDGLKGPDVSRKLSNDFDLGGFGMRANYRVRIF